jgi:hypothetical protein
VAGAVMIAACTSGNGGSASAGDAGVRDARGDGAQVMACTSPQDCMPYAGGRFSVFCCIAKTCAYRLGGDVIPCTDANVQLIQASDYDRSCGADSDCVEIYEGNFCYAGVTNCTNAAIRKSALPQYQSDVAKTNASVCRAIGDCPFVGVACCRSGTCQLGPPCYAQVDASDEDGRAEAANSEAGEAGGD